MLKKNYFITGSIFLFSLRLFPCTSLMVTPGASVDKSAMVTYIADSHLLYGELYHWPEATHPKNSWRDIYEWETGKFLGRIKEVPHTFQVTGNMNEHQLVIAETTFGGRKELQDTTGILDYGSLIYITLQRARTAREAIRVMTSLVNEYGYYSTGESFSVMDPDEGWILEMTGKGPGRKGAVWVAMRIPDGYICAHANQARIRQFPLHDRDNCSYSPDVISFAREKGYFKGKDDEFSFADAYAPYDRHNIRFCEARVWSIYRRAAPSMSLPWQLIEGKDTTARLPLWIKPDKPLTLKEVMSLMRDHYEGTPLDMRKGVAAGPSGIPYRWRPLTWKTDGKEYFHERAISTQQTAFSFVAQCRRSLPSPIGGVLWFGVDDTYSTVYTPFYCCLSHVPTGYKQGNGTLFQYSDSAAFWLFNRVSHLAYLRYHLMIEDIRAIQSAIEDSLILLQPEIEKEALGIYRNNPGHAVGYLTAYSCQKADELCNRWKKLFEELLVKYLDGNVKTQPGECSHPGYPEWWYRIISKESGCFY